MRKGEREALQLQVIREMNWAPLNTTKNETGLVFRVDFHLEEGTPTYYTKRNSAKWRLVGGPSTWPIVKADGFETADDSGNVVVQLAQSIHDYATHFLAEGNHWPC